MKFTVFCVLFAAAAAGALFIIFKPIITDKKIRKGIRNSDSLMQHYSFLLYCTQSEAIEQLSYGNVNDILAYSFDKKSLTIVFERFSTSITCRLSFYNVGGKSYLKVSRMNFLHSRSNIPFLLNRFFIEKIAAEPIDYSAFEEIVRNAA